jgi:hypothetical protein
VELPGGKIVAENVADGGALSFYFTGDEAGGLIPRSLIQKIENCYATIKTIADQDCSEPVICAISAHNLVAWQPPGVLDDDLLDELVNGSVLSKKRRRRSRDSLISVD